MELRLDLVSSRVDRRLQSQPRKSVSRTCRSIAWSGEFDFEVTSRLREQRGDGWWLSKPSRLHEWNADTGYADPDEAVVPVPRL